MIGSHTTHLFVNCLATPPSMAVVDKYLNQAPYYRLHRDNSIREILENGPLD